MAPLLSVENVSKELNVRGKKVLALESLGLTVDEGEFLTVVGPSGCGKSTLLNLIVGLLPSSAGRILFRNRPINGINPEIGYITQKDNLLPWRTLVQNVEIALEIRGTNKGERRERAEELIERVGLKGFEDHYPHELSGGMRQRANIIWTLIYDPELILMDEPFGPLDAQTRIVLQDQLLKLWSATKKIFAHLAITLYETFSGFFIGSLIGIGFGFLLARKEVLAQVLDPYIVAFNGIPRIALAPIFIIWFGIGPNSKIILVVIVVFFLTFFNTYSGVKGVDIELKNILRIMGASERQILFKVTIPATIPWITTGLKLSVPYALVGAVVDEFIAASKGLGYLINYNTSLFSTTGALGGILVLALVVVLCNEVIDRTEAYLLRWRPKEEVRGGRELY